MGGGPWGALRTLSSLPAGALALTEPGVDKSCEGVRDTGRRKDPVVQPQNRRNELSVN